MRLGPIRGQVAEIAQVSPVRTVAAEDQRQVRGEHITKVLLSSADGDEDLHRELHRGVGRLSQRRGFRRQLV